MKRDYAGYFGMEEKLSFVSIGFLVGKKFGNFAN